MKVYHSLDFSKASARIEPNVAGEYIVQDEDFEDINDLVARAARSRSRLPDMSSDMVEYDDTDVFVEDIKNDLSQNTAKEPSEEAQSGERSDTAGALADGDKDVSVTP